MKWMGTVQSSKWKQSESIYSAILHWAQSVSSFYTFILIEFTGTICAQMGMIHEVEKRFINISFSIVRQFKTTLALYSFRIDQKRWPCMFLICSWVYIFSVCSQWDHLEAAALACKISVAERKQGLCASPDVAEVYCKEK